jgi:molybdopterin synthase catalytic subunit
MKDDFERLVYSDYMNVSVRVFAGMRECLGKREVEVQLQEGSTIADLHDQLAQTYPEVASYLATIVSAVHEEYVPNEHQLREGDEVALIPPVSGGSSPTFGPIRVTDRTLEAGELVQSVRKDESGALVLFYGVARNHSEGRRVVALEYDAYPSMAERKLREVAQGIAEEWPITGIGILHRTGRLEIGDASLLVGVSAAHRAAAFEACHRAVDRIKQIVPIWKKEIWEDGDGEWVAGHTVEAGQPNSLPR